MTDPTADLVNQRQDVVSTLRRELVGPASGADETVVGKPAWRYLAGILFPQRLDQLRQEEEDERDPTNIATAEDESLDPNVAAAYDLLPASMGISFCFEGASELRVAVRGARYVKVGAEASDGERELPLPDDANDDSKEPRAKRDKAAESWQRMPLASEDSPDIVRLPVPSNARTTTVHRKALSGAAEVSARFRPLDRGNLVTITLVNRLEPMGSSDSEVEAMIFQCGFTVHLDRGSIMSYPDLQRFSMHPEDEELALIYRNRRSYGIGHGCAATWEPGQPLRTICADPFPFFEVRALTNRIELSREAEAALDIRWLADPRRTSDEASAALNAFACSYETWVETQEEQVKGLPTSAKEAASRLLSRQHRAIVRMRRGISLLVDGPAQIREAFRMAQEAMLRQFAWVANRAEGPFDIGDGRTGPLDPIAKPPQGAVSLWYPFQLAFQLLVLESLTNPESDDRDLVDLLWFPTGGGKTEAYLALAAFEMIRRRLSTHDSGTAVIMRYTLRLLTSQQFERCATLVSVLESMRRGPYHEELGEVPFRLGLWVGGQLTPNRLSNDHELNPGATQLLEQLLEDEEPENPFLLRTCPRCGTRLVPRRKSPEASHYGIVATASRFAFRCPDPKCELTDEIPASVVDDDLFRNPPTFIIGTVDKFARMVWDARSRVFLGCGRDALPPTLVIQDELHLINGPLGSIAGGYEAGIETVVREGGARPKYLASTATIQRAREQCLALYAKEPFVFPPSGLDASDSFFTREDGTTPGRLYLGVMGNGLYSSLTTLIQVSAAAAHAATSIPADNVLSRDTYWTQVIYHNSKQELGKTTTMLRDDVRTRLYILEPEESLRRPFELVEELSANLKGSAVSEALERLEVEFPDPGVIDAVACTNMISVGVDVGRLGLMIVKGQPKSTAEYIQASSRVGRERRRPAGIVLTIYSPFRPRDRSHFETFQSYHASLYRAVEPTSVTPFSAPARDRTLHAGLVLALRHAMAWEDGRDASKFDPTQQDQRRIINTYRKRVLAACRPDESEETDAHLNRLMDAWAHEAALKNGRPLSFDPMKQFRSLLTTFPREQGPDGLWATLNSMRHVDGETPFEVRGQHHAGTNAGMSS